jgi:prophage tail gpP-like protein
VFDDRRLQAAVDQRRGESVSEDTLTKLAEAASIWHRDSASLGMALTAVGATQVPDMTLAEALQVDAQETEALEAMAEGYQIELKRQILEESDG